MDGEKLVRKLVNTSGRGILGGPTFAKVWQARSSSAADIEKRLCLILVKTSLGSCVAE